jgi:hypothetical protein
VNWDGERICYYAYDYVSKYDINTVSMFVLLVYCWLENITRVIISSPRKSAFGSTENAFSEHFPPFQKYCPAD